MILVSSEHLRALTHTLTLGPMTVGGVGNPASAPATGESLNRITKTAIAMAATGAAFVATSGTAMAAGPGGVETCPDYAFCVYYNSSESGWGSFINWTRVAPGTTWNLNGLTFGHYGNGSGYGQNSYHNIAAVVNNTGDMWRLYAGTASETYPDGFAGDVSPTIKNAETSLEQVD